MKHIESKEKLISALSHDFRNPLGAILAYTDLLEGSGELSGKSERQVIAIRRAARRLDSMIQNIVELTRLQTGQKPLEKVALDLTELAASLSESFASIAVARKNTLSFEVLPSPEPVIADRARLLHVLGVLILNAIQHSPEGAPVAISITPQGGKVKFAVRDLGPGLTKDDLTQLLGPELNEIARPSRGLSLYLARYILEAHASKLLATSELGRGTEFWFFL